MAVSAIEKMYLSVLSKIVLHEKEQSLLPKECRKKSVLVCQISQE